MAEKITMFGRSATGMNVIWKKKKAPLLSQGLLAERGDSHCPLMGNPRTKSWHCVQIKKDPFEEGPFSGEGGIRTREPLRVTRAPGVRAKPDYATSPNFERLELYHLFHTCQRLWHEMRV